MTEAEWLAATDPQPMLEHLRSDDRVSRRKYALFALACCRRVRHLLPDPRSRSPLEDAEEYEDFAYVSYSARAAAEAAVFASGSMSSRVAARMVADLLVAAQQPGWGGSLADNREKRRRYDEYPRACAAAAARAVALAVGGDADRRSEPRGQASVLLDLFGNPSRPAGVNPAWLAWNDGTVARLAEAAYEERELPGGHLSAARLALVADALEDASCADAELLGHLRSAGPHVRGCWAIDLLTGRA